VLTIHTPYSILTLYLLLLPKHAPSPTYHPLFILIPSDISLFFFLSLSFSSSSTPSIPCPTPGTSSHAGSLPLPTAPPPLPHRSSLIAQQPTTIAPSTTPLHITTLSRPSFDLSDLHFTPHPPRPSSPATLPSSFPSTLPTNHRLLVTPTQDLPQKNSRFTSVYLAHDESLNILHNHHGHGSGSLPKPYPSIFLHPLQYHLRVHVPRTPR
jgi:hypothetical protein